MAIAIETGRDVVAFLKAQHEQIKDLFSAVRASSGEPRKRAFIELRRLLAVHETAEEEIVHPAARKILPEGNSLVNVRLMEENKAKKELSALEDLDADSAEFNARIGSLALEVMAHANAEERQEFEPLALNLNAEQLARMRRASSSPNAWRRLGLTRASNPKRRTCSPVRSPRWSIALEIYSPEKARLTHNQASQPCSCTISAYSTRSECRRPIRVSRT